MEEGKKTPKFSLSRTLMKIPPYRAFIYYFPDFAKIFIPCVMSGWLFYVGKYADDVRRKRLEGEKAEVNAFLKQNKGMSAHDIGERTLTSILGADIVNQEKKMGTIPEFNLEEEIKKAKKIQEKESSK